MDVVILVCLFLCVFFKYETFCRSVNLRKLVHTLFLSKKIPIFVSIERVLPFFSYFSVIFHIHCVGAPQEVEGVFFCCVVPPPPHFLF